MDLRDRLHRTRWPDQLDTTAWSYGADLDVVRSVCDYWADTFDWRGAEAAINAYPQFTCEVDGELLHLIHARSPHENATPLVLLHGWPGSIVEFLAVIDALTDPTAHGGSPDDAFHVVVPSLPGFGFSGPTRSPGRHAMWMGDVVDAVMSRLGYDRYGIHGTDWGAIITTMMTSSHAASLLGAHVTFLMAGEPPADGSDPAPALTDVERADLAANAHFQAELSGYTAMQGTRPQTLAYGLNDSPAGMAAWILDRFYLSSDCDGDLDTAIDRDELVTNLMIYWVTGTINSSMRIYYETGHAGAEAYAGIEAPAEPVPVGHTLFPKEAMRFPRRWAEAQYHLTRWTRMSHGGHFAGLEQPELLVDEIRAFFAELVT